MSIRQKFAIEEQLLKPSSGSNKYVYQNEQNFSVLSINNKKDCISQKNG